MLLPAARSAKAMQETTFILLKKKKKKGSEIVFLPENCQSRHLWSSLFTSPLTHRPSAALLVPCHGERRQATTREGLCPVARSHSAGPWYPVCVAVATGQTIFFSPFQLSEILKFGLDKLLSSEGSSVGEVDLESILGETEDGQWAADTPPAAEGGSAELEEASKRGEGWRGTQHPGLDREPGVHRVGGPHCSLGQLRPAQPSSPPGKCPGLTGGRLPVPQNWTWK